MTKIELFTKLHNVEVIAEASKLKRMLSNPLKYFSAILFRELIYRMTKKEREIKCGTFFGTQMTILLPSSTDIFLTGGKSHISEIGLAKFLINYLNEGDTFIDIGAHYGYFSLLSSALVGPNGQVISFEAAPTTFDIFNKNQKLAPNISGYNNAISNETSDLIFYEFPNLYSEFNTIDNKQFQNESWYTEYAPKQITVKGIVLDDFIEEHRLYPKIIKIDVEGAEYKVLEGAIRHLQSYNPIVVMEYLSNERSNKEHKNAEILLISFGYKPHSIDTKGELIKLEDISMHLNDNDLISDNIVFLK